MSFDRPQLDEFLPTFEFRSLGGQVMREHGEGDQPTQP